MADGPDEMPTPALTRQAIRTPRAAAIAGIAFSVLLTAAFVLMRLAVPRDPEDAGTWLTDGGKRDLVIVALNLLPFAGIAFLWFIGVVRDRIGDSEDRFFATVFLGSGLLFIAMLFATGAVAGGLVLTASERPAAGVGRSAAEPSTRCSPSTPCGWPQCSRSPQRRSPPASNWRRDGSPFSVSPPAPFF